MNEALNPLVEMTRTLGQPQMNYVIIGEGNTSYRVNDAHFWIKASGRGMNGIAAESFVQVRLAPILDLLEQPLTGDALQAAMQAARVDTESAARPSVEVTFHAALLHGCDGIAEDVVELEDVLRDRAERHAEQAIRAKRRHTHAQ